jgi:hypothetical protein
LLSFSSAKLDKYGGPHKLWQNIDFIVVIITQVGVMISQQGKKFEKSGEYFCNAFGYIHMWLHYVQ